MTIFFCFFHLFAVRYRRVGPVHRFKIFSQIGFPILVQMTIPEIRDFLKIIVIIHLDRDTRSPNPYTCKIHDSQQI